MFIPIRKYFKTTEPSLHLEEKLDFSDYSFTNFSLQQPVNVSLMIEAGMGVAKITLTLEAVFLTNCSRCLDEVQYEETIESNFKVMEEDLLDDMFEIPFTDEGTIDLFEMVYQEILVNAPNIFLCNDDCKGLCQRCGKKKEICTCVEEKQIDPRLAVLQQLLDKD